MLLIGEDPADAFAVQRALADERDGVFALECMTLLSEGLERLSREGVAAILLDLNLPDSHGLASFEQVWRVAPHVPILIITSTGGPGHRQAGRQARRPGLSP